MPTMLTVYKFDTPDGAEHMLETVKILGKQQSITLDDAAVVTWQEGAERPRIRHLNDVISHGVLSGAFWGMFFGLVFFMPYWSSAIGAPSGAIVGLFGSYGIDKLFLKSVNEQVTEGDSALFVMSNEVVIDEVTAAAKENGLKFEIIANSINDEQEALLKSDFSVQQDCEVNIK